LFRKRKISRRGKEGRVFSKKSIARERGKGFQRLGKAQERGEPLSPGEERGGIRLIIKRLFSGH